MTGDEAREALQNCTDSYQKIAAENKRQAEGLEVRDEMIRQLQVNQKRLRQERDEARDYLAASESTKRRLAEIIARYGRHGLDCRNPDQCNCGLAAALESRERGGSGE